MKNSLKKEKSALIKVIQLIKWTINTADSICSIFQRDKENKRGYCKIGWFLGMHEMQISEEISVCKSFNSQPLQFGNLTDKNVTVQFFFSTSYTLNKESK